MTTAAVAKKQQASIREMLESDEFRGQLMLAATSVLTPARLIRVSLTAINKTPKLFGCTPSSLAQCVLDCCTMGLEPDGRRAHLIPYKDKCTLIIDYKGLIELARRSGEVLDWQGVLVCENDTFKATATTVLEHLVDWHQPDRGTPYAVYSVVTFKDGTKGYDIMTVAEVNAIRKRSRSGNQGPWVTDWGEMAKKTVIRRHSKVLPLSCDFRDAVDKDMDVMQDVTDSVESVVVPPSDLSKAISAAKSAGLYDQSMEVMGTGDEVRAAMAYMLEKNETEKQKLLEKTTEAPKEDAPKETATAKKVSKLAGEVAALEEGRDPEAIKATRDQLGILPTAALDAQDTELLSLLKSAYKAADKQAKGQVDLDI